MNNDNLSMMLGIAVIAMILASLYQLPFWIVLVVWVAVMVVVYGSDLDRLNEQYKDERDINRQTFINNQEYTVEPPAKTSTPTYATTSEVFRADLEGFGKKPDIFDGLTDEQAYEILKNPTKEQLQ